MHGNVIKTRHSYQQHSESHHLLCNFNGATERIIDFGKLIHYTRTGSLHILFEVFQHFIRPNNLRPSYVTVRMKSMLILGSTVFDTCLLYHKDFSPN